MRIEIRALDRLPSGTAAKVADVLAGGAADEAAVRAAAALIGRAVLRVTAPVDALEYVAGDALTLEQAREYVAAGRANERTARRARAELRTATEALELIAGAPTGNHDAALAAAQILASRSFEVGSDRSEAALLVGSRRSDPDSRRIRAVIACGSRAAHSEEVSRTAAAATWWGLPAIAREIATLDRIGYGGALAWQALADRRVLEALATFEPGAWQARLNVAVAAWQAIQGHEPTYGALTEEATAKAVAAARGAACVAPWTQWGALIRATVHDARPVGKSCAKVAAVFGLDSLRYQVTRLAALLSAEPVTNPGADERNLEAAIADSRNLGAGAIRGCLARWVQAAYRWHHCEDALNYLPASRAGAMRWDMLSATGRAARAFDTRLVEAARGVALAALVQDGEDGGECLVWARLLARTANAHEAAARTSRQSPDPEDPASIQGWIEHVAPIVGALDAAVKALPGLATALERLI